MLRQITNSMVQRLFSFTGYRLIRDQTKHRYNWDALISPTSPLVKWLRSSGINTVLDVGAHQGETSRWYHHALPEAQIYAFEPLSDCFSILTSKMKGIPNFKAFKIACGEYDKQQVMYRSESSASSSLLEMKTLHKTLFPHTAGMNQETVDVRRLDNIMVDFVLKPNILLKIDTQGYEDRVLKGAVKTLKHTSIVVTEILFQSLYEGQTEFSAIYDLLRGYGFVFSGIWQKYERSSPINGLSLYCDAVFIKNNIKPE